MVEHWDVTNIDGICIFCLYARKDSRKVFKYLNSPYIMSCRFFKKIKTNSLGEMTAGLGCNNNINAN